MLHRQCLKINARLILSIAHCITTYPWPASSPGTRNTASASWGHSNLPEIRTSGVHFCHKVRFPWVRSTFFPESSLGMLNPPEGQEPQGQREHLSGHMLKFENKMEVNKNFSVWPCIFIEINVVRWFNSLNDLFEIIMYLNLKCRTSISLIFILNEMCSWYCPFYKHQYVWFLPTVDFSSRDARAGK